MSIQLTKIPHRWPIVAYKATDDEVRREFEKERDRIVAEIEDLEFAAVSFVLIRLEQLRRAIHRILSLAIEAGEFDSLHSVLIKEQIATELAAFEREVTEEVGQRMGRAFNLGESLVKSSVQKTGVTLITFPIDDRQRRTAVTFMSQLFRDLTADVRGTVNSIVTDAAEGRIAVQRAIDLIADKLPDESVFTSIRARAEAIVRSQILGGVSITSLEQLQNVADAVERDTDFRIGKAWITRGDDRVRPSHIRAGIDYGIGMEPGPVAPNEVFMVQVNQLVALTGLGPAEPLRFPRDPEASNGNIMGCRCILIPVLVDKPKQAAA